MGLTSEDLENLDAVEGSEFERVTVGVVLNVSLKTIISNVLFEKIIKPDYELK